MSLTRIDREAGPIAVRYTNPHNQPTPMAYAKPIGFWYSVDGDWERWCESEQPDWLKGRYVHEVKLGEEDMVLIRDTLSLDLFHEKYFKGDRWTGGIDWPSVAAEFDGIEIAPYQWGRRLDGNCSRWYYGWDCASGCIWRPRGVEIVLCESPTKPKVKR